MQYTESISIPKKELETIKKYVSLPNCNEYTENPSIPLNYQGEDNTMSYTATFENNIEIDIKCCGSNNGPSWIEAVMFENGQELYCSECYDNILDTVSFTTDNGDVYNVIVCEEVEQQEVLLTIDFSLIAYIRYPFEEYSRKAKICGKCHVSNYDEVIDCIIKATNDIAKMKNFKIDKIDSFSIMEEINMPLSGSLSN